MFSPATGRWLLVLSSIAALFLGFIFGSKDDSAIDKIDRRLTPSSIVRSDTTVDTPTPVVHTQPQPDWLSMIESGDSLTALETLAKASSAEQNEWLPVIIKTWAKFHPDELPVLADALRNAGFLERYAHELADGWAKRAPVELASYASQMEPGTVRSTLLHGALNEWILRDPQAVIAWMPDLAGQPEWDWAIAQLVSHTDRLVRTEATAASWAESISDDTTRHSVLLNVIHEWSQNNPDAARAWVAKLPSSVETNPAALLAVIETSSQPEL